MQTTPNLYTDIDYESFPIADLDLDRHWIQLPNSVLAARRQARGTGPSTGIARPASKSQ